MYGDANNWDSRLGEGRVVPCDRTALSPQMSPVFPGLNPGPSDKMHSLNKDLIKQKRYTRRCEISTLRAVYIPGKHCRLTPTGAKLS